MSLLSSSASHRSLTPLVSLARGAASTPAPDFSRLPGARAPKTPAATTPRSLRIPTAKAARTALTHCVELVKKHDKASYLATLLMPSTAQPHIFALLAANVEIALTRDKVSSVSTTAMYRLKFWRDAFAAIYKGDGLVPQQPVATALVAFARSSSVDLLDQLASCRQRTIGDRPFQTMNEVYSYGRDSTGSLLRLQAHALRRAAGMDADASTTASDAVIDRLAEAHAALTLVRSAGPFTLRRVVLLPAELLVGEGLTPDNVVSGKNPEKLAAAVQRLTEMGAKRLQEARDARSSVPRAERAALWATAAQCEHVVKVARAARYDIRSQLLQRPRPLLAWRLLGWRLTGGY
ncbi:hypothetical protein PFISCL1PPCAC_8262 [Pristionchus fissidentatus]|uniref:15-cis-phytoene synthase n=1 Tax=Pristionchus fissidentatus TaxID=1538716 RepID=A0AAV5VGA6_9BILA|nr:hypothetical protein PFISCL1PPCAC_8262 [Pristionchus fissidentatus]